MKILSFLMFAWILAGLGSLAHCLEPSSSGKSLCGLQIQLPADWKSESLEKLKTPLCFQATDAGKTISMMILKSQDANAHCVEFLGATEQSRKQKNVLPEKEKMMSAGALKAAGVQEGVRAQYLISEPKMSFPVIQESVCLKKGPELRMVQWAYQKRNQGLHQPLVQKMIQSIRW